MDNGSIADVFLMTSKLMDVHGGDESTIKNYANLSFQLDRLHEPIAGFDDTALKGIQGVGARNLAVLKEVIATETLNKLTELLAATPLGVLELMKIKGLGPKKVKLIWQEMGITEPSALLHACEENRLIQYKGFSDKVQQSIKESTEFYLNSKGKYLPHQVMHVAAQLQKYFEKLLKTSVALVGDLPRQMEIVERTELLIAAPVEKIQAVLNPQYFSETNILDNEIQTTAYNIKLFLISCSEEHFAKQCLQRNSSATFYESIEANLNKSGTNEADLLLNNGLVEIPAYLREDAYPTAQQKWSPSIIKDQDIKGIIHNHSTYSDGAHSLLQMAEACIERGYQYFVISDHSQYASYANGLSFERILQQHQEIDLLNKQLAPFKIFKSIECDILPDGSLDYSPSVLDTLDVVVASIHSVLSMTQERAMERLYLAISNPYTSILGHPTGRLLLGRSGYPLDMPQIIAWCKQYNVAIELNANPRRLDLDWRWIEAATKKGVLISINPDAHHTDGIGDVSFGVRIAQKAGLLPQHNLSSYTLSEMEQFIAKQKQKRSKL
jgi:DNA polymerase (family X)